MNRVMLIYNGLIRFDSVALVDDKGDTRYPCPHLFVDFHSDRGPLSGGYQFLEANEYHSEQLEGLQRVEVFPKHFTKPAFGVIYSERPISVDDRTRAVLKHHSQGITLYKADDEYDYLKPADVITVDKTEDDRGKRILLKITNVRVAAGSEILKLYEDDPQLKYEIENQLSRQVAASDQIRVIEAIVIYGWQIEQNRPVI